jgi:alpha-1,2-mannosyltransferase
MTRARRSHLLSLWLIGNAFVAFMLFVGFWQVAHGQLRLLNFARNDFPNIWFGGQLIGAQNWEALYDYHAFARIQARFFGDLSGVTFSYPPTAFPLIQLFSWSSYGAGLLAWTIATALFFVMAARRIWPAGAGSAWLAILTPAAILNMRIANFGFVFGGLWLLVFNAIDRHPVRAGLLIGLFTMKPQLALLIPLILILRKAWITFWVAAASSIFCLAGSAVIYGLAPWQAFLTKGVGVQLSYADGQGFAFAPLSTSAMTVASASGLPLWPSAGLIHMIVAAFGLVLVIIAARKNMSWDRLSLLAATATFLILPYALAYDLTVVAIGALTVLTSASATRGERVLAAIGFVAPQVGVALGYAGVPLLPLLLLGLAVAQFGEAMRHADRTVTDRNLLTPDRGVPLAVIG